MNRQTDRKIDRLIDGQMGKHTVGQIEGEPRDREMNRQTDKQTNR
jgi:hypothetical protein